VGGAPGRGRMAREGSWLRGRGDPTKPIPTGGKAEDGRAGQLSGTDTPARSLRVLFGADGEKVISEQIA